MSQNSDSPQTPTGTTVLAEVADALKGASGAVKQRLVDALVERELVKRVDMLDKALLKRRDLARELAKIQPKKTYKFVGPDQVEVESTYTAEEAKQFQKTLKDATEKVTKFDAALEAAFQGNGFDKLAQLLGGKSDE